jgi:hypothetical protein
MNYDSLIKTLQKRAVKENKMGREIWEGKVYPNWSVADQKSLAQRYMGTADGINWVLKILRDRRYLEEKEAK